MTDADGSPVLLNRAWGPERAKTEKLDVLRRCIAIVLARQPANQPQHWAFECNENSGGETQKGRKARDEQHDTFLDVEAVWR
ncbi:hypothetical protein PV08_07551 [Exophiala spinifera]|uniref:Uncharacterized protein n=1 Tax=Exophiala spinifera TaxID=91928 RepID=A0A0D1YIK0_9EURO|nr:uncharacterized protein PV08_07551 [Exophiala spinifera]KIW14766.1 hypothetical protein PV08_07551 [Exophiala spinifera]